jgi:outer membrane protein OmpA-like peptidoglycan-associated protein
MDHTPDDTRPACASRLRARLLCAVACAALFAPEAYARPVSSRLPSVEVHLEVLKDLTSGATSFSAPVPGRNSISAKPLPPIGYQAPAMSEPLTASGRKVPSQQPDMGQYGALERKPVNASPSGAPFGRASAPLPKTYAAKPKAKPVAKTEAKPLIKDLNVKPAIAETAKVEAPKPEVKAQDEKKLMEALEKETASVAAPVPTPAPAPVAEVPKLEPVPDITLPAAPAIPDFKPDLALPAPVPEAPAPLAEAPKLPAPAPETLVVDKGGPALPPIPALPLPGQEAQPKAELMPSLSARMDTLFAKQPEKEGVVEDTTKLEGGVSPDAAKKAEETAGRLAEDQEKARAEQLRQQEELKKLTDMPLENNMPAPKDAPKLESTEIAALPPITLPGGPIAAANEVDLPPPALPPLTAITGAGAEKTSLDIVQPQEGIAAVSNTPPEMQPLDAPEALPIVTKGDAEAAPALPPIELPKPAAAAKPDESLPPIPDFSAMKGPTEATPAPEMNVAIAEQPKPNFVTAEEVKASEPKVVEPPAAEGVVAASLNFDKDKTDLDDVAKAQLSNLAQSIIEKNQNVRIVSYAAGTADQASIARRISLSRALQIRAFLISKQVSELKINVQAQGNKQQAERADIYVK